jgi:hypothetical protein
MTERRHRVSMDETDRNLLGVLRIRQALRSMDEFRAALAQGELEFSRAINHPSIPKTVKDLYWKFWKAGGCTGPQWVDFVNGNLPKEAVKVKRGLRLVVKNKVPRKRFHFKDDGPRVA